MNVHFCPRCGRLNLADFSYCPYCGEPAPRGPGLEEALEGPMRRIEESGAAPDGAAARVGRRMAELMACLDALESDMEELLARGRADVGASSEAPSDPRP